MSKLITLAETDNHKVIQASQGDKIDVTLTMNPSTGFFWQSADTSAGNLDRVQQDRVGEDGKPPRPGAPVNVRFRFTVESSGHFTLNYARPWDELTPPAKWWDIEIQVG